MNFSFSFQKYHSLALLPNNKQSVTSKMCEGYQSFVSLKKIILIVCMYMYMYMHIHIWAKYLKRPEETLSSLELELQGLQSPWNRCWELIRTLRKKSHRAIPSSLLPPSFLPFFSVLFILCSWLFCLHNVYAQFCGMLGDIIGSFGQELVVNHRAVLGPEPPSSGRADSVLNY